MKIYIALPEPKVLDNDIKWDTVNVNDDERTVFSLEEGITPYDMEVLLTNYL